MNHALSVMCWLIIPVLAVGEVALLWFTGIRLLLKRSFEFSKWTVQSASHNLRIIVIYRLPYADEHKVPMSTLFAEFADYVETILFSNEELLILGDFNIHIDVARDSDASFLISLNQSVFNSMLNNILMFKVIL